MGPSAARLPRLVLAWLATAAMLFASAGSPVSGHDAIDIACAAALLEQHDHSAHRIGAEPGPAPEHCEACHFTRTARGNVSAHQLAAVTAVSAGAAFVPHEPASLVDLLPDLTRGPPAS